MRSGEVLRRELGARVAVEPGHAGSRVGDVGGVGVIEVAVRPGLGGGAEFARVGDVPVGEVAGDGEVGEALGGDACGDIGAGDGGVARWGVGDPGGDGDGDEAWGGKGEGVGQDGKGEGEEDGEEHDADGVGGRWFRVRGELMVEPSEDIRIRAARGI